MGFDSRPEHGVSGKVEVEVGGAGSNCPWRRPGESLLGGEFELYVGDREPLGPWGQGVTKSVTIGVA